MKTKDKMELKKLKTKQYSDEMILSEGKSRKEIETFDDYQLKTAKKICEYLIANIETHITINQLSAHFNISQTTLKRIFKTVYGVPVFSYTRMKRMEMAQEMLKTTDNTILNIAGSLGYDNGSKFAKAFKEITGLNPNEYRKKYKTKR